MNDYGYGLWFLVAVNTAVVLIFAASFFHPQSKRDWKAFGAFSAFIVALFTEMYGAPLTVYLLSSIGGNVFGLDLTHNGGHLWTDLVGWKADPHISPFHLASYAFIVGGFWLISAGWHVLYAAHKADRLAVEGPYARVRHPQYTGFILIMVGFLLQWPTIPTLVMFPVLLYFYRHLAIREEQEVRSRFTEAWATYAEPLPRFLPRRGLRAPTPPSTTAATRPKTGGASPQSPRRP